MPVVGQGPLEELLADYPRYLLIERRLSEHTVLDAYEPAARLFMSGREAPAGLTLEQLTAADVSLFLAGQCPRRRVSGARDLVSALRSFLRYLHVAGRIDAPLVWAVPSVADLRDRTLPRGPCSASWLIDPRPRPPRDARPGRSETDGRSGANRLV